jgi:hypothetical protein
LLSFLQTLETIDEDDGDGDDEYVDDNDEAESDDENLPLSKLKELKAARKLVSKPNRDSSVARKPESDDSDFAGDEDEDDEPVRKKAKTLASYEPPAFSDFSDNETAEVQGKRPFIEGEYIASLHILQEVFISFTGVVTDVNKETLVSKAPDLVPLYGVFRKASGEACLDFESGVREFGVLNNYLDIDVNLYPKVAKAIGNSEVSKVMA